MVVITINKVNCSGLFAALSVVSGPVNKACIKSQNIALYRANKLKVFYIWKPATLLLMYGAGMKRC